MQSYPKWWYGTVLGDYSIYILMSKYGKAKFINDITSVYRHRPDGVSSKNYSFVKNTRERIYTYKHVNRDFGYKYCKIINPIIADYYYSLGKRLYKTGKRVQGLWSVIQACVFNPSILFSSIKNRKKK